MLVPALAWPHASRADALRRARSYPALRKRLDSINGRALAAARVMGYVCIANGALSAVMVYTQRYAGGRSIFGYLTQCCLLLPQLVVTLQTASDSRRHGLALSLFRSHRVSYNVMLPSYSDGAYFVSVEAQDAEAARQELHGTVLSSAARYMQARLHVAEKFEARGRA
jgi:hypothetical protein